MSAFHNDIGSLGEKIACKYLVNCGFKVIQINYRKPWGEIDVVARKLKTVHFVEVKTVSYETKEVMDAAVQSGEFKPEDQVDKSKVDKLTKTVQAWCAENNYKGDVQLDVLAIRVVSNNKYAAVEYFPNVFLDQ